MRVKYLGKILEYSKLRYNPVDDIIFPSVIRSPEGKHSLGKYYLYYAPHNKPGGICLAYADKLKGPWTEYANNPIIPNQWSDHYSVSHVSSPHVTWNDAAQLYMLYFHGENSTTRIAVSTDGISFSYHGIAIEASQFVDITEASYARVFLIDGTYRIFFYGQ